VPSHKSLHPINRSGAEASLMDPRVFYKNQ
jgi:hypothetical protein